MQLQNRLNSIIKKVRSYHPDPDIDKLREAFAFANAMHEGQVRKSGEPYMTHPLEVMDIIADLRLDVSSLVAGLLPDTVEDTDTTVEDLRDLFGEDVSFLVDGVTKLSKFSFNTREEAQAENIRKMIIAMSRDLRVILVKLADRLHNMRTLKYMSPEGQERISQETMEIYAPLAHRLGISWVKTELEDLSFRYLHADAYYEIAEKVASKKRQRENFIREVITILNDMLKENNIHADVTGRPKSFWSIYRKMRESQIEFEQMFDILAFRVLVPERVQCYEALGLVHNLWKPIPGRFKDYIAIPKPNGYQSLHTSIIGPNQERIEIQIRTSDMHKIAEEGIAAHWLYKEGKAIPDRDDQKFAWLHRLMEEQQDHEDPRDFLESVKIDLFHDEVYVFTPRGDVLSFPLGATPVDFAFAIHSEVGFHCSGAKVNGLMVPLKYQLQNGDIVDIITQKNQRPNKDWLAHVKTGRARTKIRHSVQKEQRDRSRELGRELLDRELNKRIGTNVRAWERAGNLTRAAELGKFSSVEEMLAEIGYGNTQPETILGKIYPSQAKVTPSKSGKSEGGESRLGQLWDKIVHRGKTGVVLDGIEDVMVQYARCCNPVPGDEIIGFVTRGRGLSVHTRDCARITHLERERQITVRWDNELKTPTETATRRPVNVRVYCTDKPGLLANISQSFTQAGVNISQAQCVTTEDQRAINTFEVRVTNLEQLKKAMKKIEKIKGVYKVERN